MKEDWLSFRETPWGVADGRRIPIKDLAIDHLVNILNWVDDRSTIYPLLVEEANYRKVIQFASNKPVPALGSDGRWILINTKGKVVSTKKKTEYPTVGKPMN